MGANADLVLTTWSNFLKGDVKAAFANLHDDATWTIPGLNPDLSGVKRGKAEILGFLRGVVRWFTGHPPWVPALRSVGSRGTAPRAPSTSG